MGFWQGRKEDLAPRERAAIEFAEALFDILPVSYDETLPIQNLCRIFDQQHNEIDGWSQKQRYPLVVDGGNYLRQLERIYGDTRNLAVGDRTITSVGLHTAACIFMDWASAYPEVFTKEAHQKINFYRHNEKFLNDIYRGEGFMYRKARPFKPTP